MADLTADFSVTFDNYNLNNIPFFTMTRRFPNELPDVDIVSHNRVWADGALVTDQRFRKKVIEMEGYILAPSRTAYEETIDILKLRLSAVERPLVLIQGATTRVYTATVGNIVHEHIEAGKARINVEFICSDPFGKNLTTDTSIEQITTASKTLDLVFGGTALTRPRFIVTVTALTDGTNKYIAIQNSHTNQQVKVTRTWTAGDVVEFDCENKRITLNGSSIIDFDGVFPSFTPGEQTAAYADDFTTRDVTVRTVYTKRYL